MRRFSLVAVVLGIGAISCTGQKLPPPEIINFRSATMLEMEICRISAVGSLAEANAKHLRNQNGLIRAAKNTSPQDLVDAASGVFNASKAKPIVEATQQETQACSDKAAAKIESLWPQALAAARDQPEAKLLQNYYETWKSALAAQRPEFKDFWFGGPGEILGPYQKRVRAASQLNAEAWKTLLEARMSPDHFCLEVLPTYSISRRGDDSIAILLSADAYDVSMDDLKSVEYEKPRIGMKKCAIMALFGKASEIQASTDRLGVKEIWKYTNNKQVEFQDGLVKSFSN